MTENVFIIVGQNKSQYKHQHGYFMEKWLASPDDLDHPREKLILFLFLLEGTNSLIMCWSLVTW